MNSFIPNESFLLTPEQEGQWSNAIGGVFLNFSFLEFTSVRWIKHFSRDEILNDLSIDLNFSKRAILINQFIKRSDWPDLVKNESRSLWSEASRLSEHRNTIAHNPLAFGSTVEGMPAWGIVNIKKMKGPGPFST